MKNIIIAIDGFSSCGKSTLAKALAREFQYRYIDTGAMYRAVALYFMRKEMLRENFDRSALIRELPKIQIDFQFDPAKDETVTFLNGENVEDEIRGVAVSREVSKVSQISEVRNRLVAQQQEMGKQKGVVMDGRDIGTRVFPDAELKLFVTADPEVRVERRFQQMLRNGVQVDRDDIKKNLEQRDYDDVHKGDHPLKQAKDAIVIDNTDMTPIQQFELSRDMALEAMKD